MRPKRRQKTVKEIREEVILEKDAEELKYSRRDSIDKRRQQTAREICKLGNATYFRKFYFIKSPV